ncbi:ABC transporter permease subunit, partial [Enterobacter hormaechei]|uniref:ABC transporter permease subunit n=1 Tax=Enterobacter hormaechei TaxID=158836 RepID=UPI003CC5FE72
LTLGLMVVILSGGIDLSVGTIYGLTNFATIAILQGFHLPVLAGLVVALAVGGAIGLINGVLVGIFKMRAFLSTLATLIIGRSVQETLSLHYG